MTDKASAGELFGIPYNFDRPSLRRLISAYWQPKQGMLVEKPFGIGYTLNLANWRSWIALGVVAALLWQERAGENEETDDKPVDVVVDDDKST